MALKTFRPRTPSLRGTILQDFSELTKRTPEKSLTVAKRKTGGRNNLGRMTARGIGGGHKQRYRIIDFKRNKVGVPAIVEAIEYDPNRSARIALLKYTDGEKRYIIAPMGLEVGAKVMSGPDAELATGNCLPLRRILPGMPIHNIEIKHGKGGQICRSAGLAATIMVIEGDYAMVKLPSGEVRKIQADCYATIGQVVVVAAAADHVDSGAANQRVTAFVAVQSVVAQIAFERVGALGADKPVVALAAIQVIASVVAVDRVVAFAA